MADYIELLPWDKDLKKQMADDRLAAATEGVGTTLQKNAAAFFDSPWSLTKWFNDLGMPIPNFWVLLSYGIDSDEVNVMANLDFWTCIMEWPPIQALALWGLSGIIISILGAIVFSWKFLMVTGFAGWGYEEKMD